MNLHSNVTGSNTWLSWSSGKDALYQLLRNKYYSISKLFTTVTKEFERVSLHSTRKQLLQVQANRLSLPIELVEIPKDCSNVCYQEIMLKTIVKAESENVRYMAFGDLFLDSVKKYREKQLELTKINPVFPLWLKNTNELPRDFIEKGFKAIIVSIDTTKMPKNLIGHEYNMDFLKKLPTVVDPCGENGEFHTFVYDVPIFSRPINYVLGNIVEKDDMLYSDVLLNEN